MVGTLHKQLLHQFYGEGPELMDEVLAPSYPRMSHTVDRTVIPTASALQRAYDHALLVEDLQGSSRYLLDMVVTDAPISALRTLPQQKIRHFLNLEHERREVRIKSCF